MTSLGREPQGGGVQKVNQPPEGATDQKPEVGAGFTPARAKSIPCFSASKQRTLYEMMWSVSRPRSVTPDSGGDKPLPYKVFNLQRKEIRVDCGGGV